MVRRLEVGGPAISSLAAYSGLDADVLPAEGWGAPQGDRTGRANDFWWDRLASDPDAVGRDFVINGHPFTVVGIAPAGVRETQPHRCRLVWLPSSAMSVVMARVPPNILTMDGVPLLMSVIRRRIGDATPDAVSNQLTALAPELAGVTCSSCDGRRRGPADAP